MKARVQTGAVLLCCFENPDEQDALRRFFTQRRIAVYTAGSEDLGRAVGPLLGQPGGAAQPQGAAAAVPPEPALVFSALSDRSLEQVLTALREQQLAAGCLKAVLTPHNRGWALGALLEELRRERGAIASKAEAEEGGAGA